MRAFRNGLIAVLGCHCVAGAAYPAALDEFKVKRQEVYEFTEKPALKREGDRVSITFASKGYCDVTVAIENPEKKIIRHLASGVLGPNAPEPLQKNSLRQTLIWDGKTDQEKYVDNLAGASVRVSLGLKPEFEKSLYWSPKKRISGGALLSASAEGVYVYDGHGMDHLRLFDHEGNFLRTIYPFPANRIDQVVGLPWKEYPQEVRMPLKQGRLQQTFLTCGDNCSDASPESSGSAASALAARGNRVALAKRSLHRLASDGSSGGLKLQGPKTSFPAQDRGSYGSTPGQMIPIPPGSVACSPDGQWLYLSHYHWTESHGTGGSHNFWLNGVVRMRFDGESAPEVFAGSMKQGAGRKYDKNTPPDPAETGNGNFRVACCVICDEQGLVYVADYMNDRVQVFSPEGKHLRNIAVAKPAWIGIHHKTKELYVGSWLLQNWEIWGSTVKPVLRRMGPLPEPKLIAEYPLALNGHHEAPNFWDHYGGLQYSLALDEWAPEPVLWLVPGAAEQSNRSPGQRWSSWVENGIKLLTIKDGKLVLKKDFGKEVEKEIVKAGHSDWRATQRMAVNPKNGKAYLAEYDSGPAGKTFMYLVEIDPSGAIREIETPFNAEDFAFDINGLLYLRSTDVVGRFETDPMREVPWDYGEELAGVNSGSAGGLGFRSANLLSGLTLPSSSPVCFHQGGMAVSVKGHLAVSCAYRYTGKLAYEAKQVSFSKPYTPKLYPGRLVSPTSASVHIWDKHGKILVDDALQGAPQLDGIGLDKDDRLYVMATPARNLEGKTYTNILTATLIKFVPGAAKFISSSASSPLPIPEKNRPARPQEILGMWVDGAEWFYGGVGYSGFNSPVVPSCACWHSRFCLDFFARSWAPEPERYGVAVLDSAGNLILRVGRYGNEDSAGAGSLVPLGGDEVGLVHPCFTAVDTDRRLFIADIGNARVSGVKLGYHAEERVALMAAQSTEAGAK